ncbi:hypothetical protein Salat_0626400 [Sesamum alatum]|uniref:Uncharacterized protein n=1 Tax=Sesamum alatum TaxID=300844 RepID=A0AAE1YQP4_9LAMI|nr:hypothetical protein Salat_0626400 [Sesamum alatum]
MEAVVLHGSVDQPLSSSKSHMMITNPWIIHQPPFISRSFEPSNIHSMGLLRAPPSFLYHPPLLPPPAAHRRRSNSSRGPSCPPLNRNSDHRTTTSKPKKSKSPTKSPKIAVKKSPGRSSDAGMILDTDRKGLWKNDGEVFSSDSMGIMSTELSLERLGCGVFIISPPPSSLPLPTFSLRPKLSCDTKAAGMGNGATDNLRRLLRLQST